MTNLQLKGAVPIAHFEEKYLICPSGKIWNKDKRDWQAVSENPNGYFKVQLKLRGKHKQYLVHRLVALHFLPNPYAHPQVNHKDGDKFNNSVDNLEWVNREQNIQHSLEIGLRKGFMSLDDKRALLRRVLKGELIRDLAKETGRREESLSGMLRRAADKLSLRAEWDTEMKRRRALVAVRNLEKINN